jgi:hypothetical protein
MDTLLLFIAMVGCWLLLVVLILAFFRGATR